MNQEILFNNKIKEVCDKYLSLGNCYVEIRKGISSIDRSELLCAEIAHKDPKTGLYKTTVFHVSNVLKVTGIIGLRGMKNQERIKSKKYTYKLEQIK